jgi:hypothetical protein
MLIGGALLMAAVFLAGHGQPKAQQESRRATITLHDKTELSGEITSIDTDTLSLTDATGAARKVPRAEIHTIEYR